MRMSTEKALESMRKGGWFDKRGTATSIRDRTPEQCAWDSAILCTTEFIRRTTGNENTVALALATPIQAQEVPAHPVGEASP